ncbi:MAG: histidinol-phosphatase [Oscillospiraceae bacterium]|nr:histidinol-phosphatase [Oscillospiraceae bacterium]
MLHNYHTHTFRNHHAVGTEREYIEAAIAGGYQTLGFSEHAPYQFPDGIVSYFHMFPEDLEDYIQTLLALKEEYAGRIEILIGYEAEYYPRFFDDLLARITQYPVDYLLLGQHYIRNEIDGVYVYEPTDDPKVLATYVNQCIEALQTGLYTYLAHPDLINFTGSETFYCREMERLCLAAKELNIPLELNLLGLRANRTYPSERFFRIAKACGSTIVAGIDAHDPNCFFQPETFEPYQKFVAACGLTVTDEITLRPVKR